MNLPAYESLIPVQPKASRLRRYWTLDGIAMWGVVLAADERVCYDP